MKNLRDIKPSWIATWFLAPLPLFLPLFFMSWVTMWATTDPIFYVNILAMVSDALHSGTILPRWFAEANDGFGSPVMMFYPPLAYLITAIINLPLLPLKLDIVIQFLIGMYASQVVSGFFAFLWLKNNFSQRIAFIGSLLFVLLPYKFIYFYGHVNLAQLWALAFLPLWILAAEKMVQGENRAIGLYALMLAATYYAHSLTLLAFGFIPVYYVLWFGRHDWLNNYTKLAAAHLLGFAICLMRMLPQHYAFAWIHVEEFLEGRFNWSGNLNHIDIFLCSYYAIAAFVGVQLQRIPELRESLYAKASRMWIWVMIIVLFLVLRSSTVVWENVQLLQYLQFPCARLHADVLIAVVYLLCCWLAYYDKLMLRAKLICNKVTLIAVIAMFTIITNLYLFDVNAMPNDLNREYIEEMHGARIIPPPEYKTLWDCIPAPDVVHMYTSHKIPTPVTVGAGKATIASLAWQPPALIDFEADVKSQKADIIVRQCYFPLWQARDEAGDIPLLPAEDNHGLLKFTLPKGNHKVEMSYVLSPEERISRTISLIALLVSIGFLFVRKKSTP